MVKKKGSGLFKTEVVQRVAREQRLTQKVVSDVLTSTHRLIEETLREGRNVTFPGFGTFKTSKRKGGKVKDIITGEVREYGERKVAYFHVGEILKRAVQGENRRGKRSAKK